MTLRALIFDCDGVLADTERDGHLPAFNATFENFGLPVRWSLDEYIELVRIGGGKERLATLFNGPLAGTEWDPRENGRADVVAAWHKAKTATYVDIVGSGRLPGRPGIRRLAEEAEAAGVQLAVASTSAEESVRAVLEHVVGTDLARGFSVFAGDIVPRKKPAPDIYQHALEALGIDAAEAVVIEDSGIGCAAATAAGIATVITTSAFTGGDDFMGATLVVPSLGDPGGGGSAASELVTLDTLRRLVS